ncbi:hypothetical protein PGT21_004513 [Puccinia graminis f. sp. tritici]|uniref:Uncharacterized protein n=1 Tax=Puccinia graminis f. sp. tritici TaxID=56615 RepID=A0A5B0QWU4_PUCGR|nr:hypothetical protein PGT21_004513 [Puccinia graminis f. sp. tritici]
MNSQQAPLRDTSNIQVNHQDPSFTPRANSADQDAGKLRGFSPVNMEQVIRAFKPQGVNKDFWAWIRIISHYVSVEREIDQHVRTSLKILKLSHSINNQCYQNPSSNLQKNSILKLAAFLWCVNLRVLELIGAPQGSEAYLKEQGQFMKWFDWFMLFFSDNLKLDLSSIYEQNHHIEIKTHGSFIYQKILQALDSSSERELYILHRPKLDSQRYCSQERQFLLNEAAVHLLGFYYKNTNFKKWNYVFGEHDIDFIRKLGELGEHWEDRAKCDLPTDLHLLPWVAPAKKALPLLGPNNLKTSHFNFHKYVEAIPCSNLMFDLRMFDKNKQFQLSKAFFLNKAEKHDWSIISSLKLRKHSNKLISEFKPSTKLVLSTQRIISEYIEEHSSSKENLISEKREILKKLNYAELEVKLNELLEFVWEINGKILQAMGSEVFEESFLKEQRLVQLFFEFLMNQNGGENAGNTPPSDRQKIRKALQKQILHNSIIELLVIKDPGDGYAVTIEEYGLRNNFWVSKKHNFLSQLALNILGNYYKNQNFERWNMIFGSDGTFIKFVKNLSDPNKYNQYEEKLFPQLRSQGLIPWKK